MNEAIEKRTIDGKEFMITKLGVEDSLKVLIWLTKSVGGSLTQGLGEFQSLAKLDDGSADNIDLSKFSEVLETLFQKIDEKETLDKIKILLSCVSHKTINLTFDSPILVGEPLLALKLAKESMGVNFKSFLGGLSGVAEKVKETVKIIGAGPK